MHQMAVVSILNRDRDRFHGQTTLRNPENGGVIFLETFVRTRATQYKVTEGIYNKPRLVRIVRVTLTPDTKTIYK